MELWYILYKGKQQTYRLIYPLGDRNGKLCCILTAGTPKKEIEMIKSRMKESSAISLEGNIRWLKTHCPFAYNNSYREIDHSNYSVLSKHKIN